VARGALKALAGKIVLIGGNLPFSDQHLTPLAALGGGPMPGVLIHANILAQMLDGRNFSELSLEFVRLVLFGVACVAGVLGWVVGTRFRNVLSWGFATAVMVAADAVVFASFRIILPFTLSLFAWVLGATAGRNMRTIVGWFKS
jgi:CHASE2 domain-containing sensor protein